MFYRAYPRHEGNQAGYRKHVAMLRKGATAEDLLAAAKLYAQACVRNEVKYVKQVSTFLVPDAHWKEYVNGVKPGGFRGRVPAGAVATFQDAQGAIC